jgi:outer membrane lipoprotein SlyB
VTSHPLDDLGMLGGAMLAGVSGVGDGAGLVLDATGVGAIAGSRSTRSARPAWSPAVA